MSQRDDTNLLSPWHWLTSRLYNVFNVLIQHVIIWLFKPLPPPSPDHPKHPMGRIAIVGAGVTGVSSAAHAIARGFDVVIYEQSDQIGGIWAHVNKTSGLQLNSLLYRFHPGVRWSCAFPHRDEILSEIGRIWKEHHLETRTRFNTPVISVKRVTGTGQHIRDNPAKSQSRWTINNGEDGEFDAVVVTVGTCGAPLRINLPGLTKHEGHQEVFEGEVLHSSELDYASFEGKTVIVIGSGASGVETVETALSKGAKKCTMLVRDDKWIIPRNVVFDALIGSLPFGREMSLSFIWEKIVAVWNYRGAPELVPARIGLFDSTPIVNDEFVGIVKSGKCEYVRCDIQKLKKRGALVKLRGREDEPGEGKEEREIEGDVIVLATGFKRPDIDFLEDDLFPEDYSRPDLYLQTFSAEDWSVLLTNSTYQDGIGTAGHFHIGIFMRILLMFLMDPDTRPTPKDMKRWVDVIRFVKSGSRGAALSFVTYMELMIWLVLFHVFHINRLRWLFFTLSGWGVRPEEYRHMWRSPHCDTTKT